MKVLIDTHVLIWYLNGDKTLSEKTIQIIEDSNNQIFISVASLWEITVKLSSGKLKLSVSLADIRNYLSNKKIAILDIDFESLIALSDLPYHHNDPFDRLIIAQATAKRLFIISSDKYFSAYNVNLLA